MSRARSRVAYLPERASRYVVSLSLAVVVAACAAVPPLDDAKLVEITRASADDMARYANAVEVRSREEFGGASFSDSKGHVIAAFSASEYDAYQAYLHVHSGQPASSLHSELSRRFPILRLTFQTSRVLFDPDASSMPVAMFSLCGADADDFVSGMQSIIWNGRFVTPERAREIEKLIKTGRAQTYEILFNYMHWNMKQEHPRGAQITLLPLPDDLCVAMHRWNLPLPSSIGRPLRISKDMVNAAAGPLPRLVPLSAAESN